MKQQNSTVVNKLKENNQELEETNQKLEENDQKLEDTKAELRTKVDQNMKKIHRQFKTLQEGIDKKWEKKYIDLDCKMVERKEQVINNSGHKDSNCKVVREQGKKLIDVEAKISQDREESIQVCKDVKEQYFSNFINTNLFNFFNKFLNSIPGQFEEVIQNKVMIIETKKFDELMRILEARDQCEKEREVVDGNKYNGRSHYNNYQHRKYNPLEK
ncbi:hypothetical protein FQA39_LY00768 [Lamprigera yunnana]|nr:hypothetical protein FQA39_LY00768 [Lamprigera yunnana]